MKKLRVGVIFGGRSGEHEVSVRTARSLIEAMDPGKYQVIPIAIAKEGKWLSPSKSAVLISGEAANLLAESVVTDDRGPSAFLLDPSESGALSTEERPGPDSVDPLDVVFPVLHGTYGEDGTIQGWLEMIGIPYVGCGVLASACGMDKVIMKTLFRDAGLPGCNYTWFLRNAFENDRETIVESVKKTSRLVTVEEGWPFAGIGAEVAMQIIEHAECGAGAGCGAPDDRRERGAADWFSLLRQACQSGLVCWYLSSGRQTLAGRVNRAGLTI